MWVYKSILISFFIALIGFGRVHQHVEIIKTGYYLEENKEYLARLSDQNSKLLYSLSRLESPKHLLSSVNPETVQFIGGRDRLFDRFLLTAAPETAPEGRTGIVDRVMDVFTVNAEAKPGK